MPSAWPTGNTPPPGVYIERRLLIPDDRDLLMAVNGALLPLLDPENWEQITGSLTPDDCAELMQTMYLDYLESG